MLLKKKKKKRTYLLKVTIQKEFLLLDNTFILN